VSSYGVVPTSAPAFGEGFCPQPLIETHVIDAFPNRAYVIEDANQAPALSGQGPSSTYLSPDVPADPRSFQALPAAATGRRICTRVLAVVMAAAGTAQASCTRHRFAVAPAFEEKCGSPR